MKSMTGYGRAEFTLAQRTYCVELRTYNNRFLDVKVRLPWIGREMDPRVEAEVRKHLGRGRVDVSVSEQVSTPADADVHQLRLDDALARDLGQVLQQLSRAVGCDLATAARLVPPLKELVVADPLGGMDVEQTWAALQQGLRGALAALSEMREAEGRATRQDLERHMAEVDRLRDCISTLAAGEPLLHQQRLLARVQGWQVEGVTIDPVRVAQEVALLADRCDVSEELARLGSHIEQMQAILTETQSVGRKMEFLLQEFNRELNTIGSKSLTAEVAHLVVEAKTSVERMREQAQNVE